MEKTYTLYFCDLCGGKQSTPLSLFTLQSYGKVETLKASFWEKHICKSCEEDFLKVIASVTP